MDMIFVALNLILCVVLLGLVILNIKHWDLFNNHQYKRHYIKNNYKIITLCGSTKFKKEFEEVQKQLTLRGNIVISVGCFGHSGDDEVFNNNKTKEMLDDMHKRKIDLADAIMVINKNNYIGESTKSEIEYAKNTGKQIFYWYD